MIDKEIGDIAKLASEMKVKADKMLKGLMAKLEGQELTREQREQLDKALKKKEAADKKLKDFLSRI